MLIDTSIECEAELDVMLMNYEFTVLVKVDDCLVRTDMIFNLLLFLLQYDKDKVDVKVTMS